jgi:hypothetical protein
MSPCNGSTVPVLVAMMGLWVVGAIRETARTALQIVILRCCFVLFCFVLFCVVLCTVRITNSLPIVFVHWTLNIPVALGLGCQGCIITFFSRVSRLGTIPPVVPARCSTVVPVGSMYAILNVFFMCIVPVHEHN